MKKFLASIFALFFLATNAAAIDKESINSVVQKDLNAAVKIIKQKSSLQTKGKQLFAMFDKYFDYSRMARIALGAHAKSLTTAQTAEFEREFVARLKASFTEKLSLYTNQKFVVAGAYAPPKPRNRYFVDVDIVGASDTYKLGFKLYTKEGANDYRVYDVEVVGVSVVAMYRSQLAGLAVGDFAGIMAAVRSVDVAGK